MEEYLGEVVGVFWLGDEPFDSLGIWNVLLSLPPKSFLTSSSLRCFSFSL